MNILTGRAELGYNYEQLAAIERLPSPDAARKALKRAVIRLSAVMPPAHLAETVRFRPFKRHRKAEEIGTPLAERRAQGLALRGGIPDE